MRLNLKNPIIFFDLETTGINIAADRIVEISYLKVDLNGNETTRTLRINPEMPIPEKVTEIHGISNEDVKEGVTVVISLKHPDPQFEGQTKSKLGNSNVKGIVDNLVSTGLNLFLEENPTTSKAIIQKFRSLFLCESAG